MTVQTAPDLGALPNWDLTDLYSSAEAPELAADLDRALALAQDLETRFKDRVGMLTGAELGAMIETYEVIGELTGRCSSYAELWGATDVTDPIRMAFSTHVGERIIAISTHTLFVELELARIEDSALDALYAASDLVTAYRPWITKVRAFRPHQLSDELERYIHDMSVVSTGTIQRLYANFVVTMRFPFRGEQLTSSQIQHQLSNPDPQAREEAATSYGKGLAENINFFSIVYSGLVKDKEVDDRWRHYGEPESFRHLINHVDGKVVDALVAAVKGAYPRLSHRYYALKAKWFGKDHLNHWDRNAPLPGAQDRVWTWDDAVAMVRGSYHRFSPELGALGDHFFADAWIDAPIGPGKQPGAFAHGTVSAVHPYLLLNYQGKTRDVMTLAHELGHGVHQILASAQRPLLSHAPLTLAETASVMGEMLTFQGMLALESDPARRKTLLAGKVEDMLNTVVRQTAFYQFESKAHRARRDGDLTPDQLAAFWMEVQSESLGPAFKLDEGYRHYWAQIPHFVHSPFYVYSYAFGDCLVNALYALYRSGVPDFEAKYMDLLRAGGSQDYSQALSPFGLDIADPAFWTKGLDVVSGFIDELEAL